LLAKLLISRTLLRDVPGKIAEEIFVFFVRVRVEEI